MQKRIPVSITYNRYLPNMSIIIAKNWSILQLSPTLLKIFDDKPMITYIEQIYILIEQINNTIITDRDIIKVRLNRREKFWILKLDTLTPKVLNQELNNV